MAHMLLSEPGNRDTIARTRGSEVQMTAGSPLRCMVLLTAACVAPIWVTTIAAAAGLELAVPLRQSGRPAAVSPPPAPPSRRPATSPIVVPHVPADAKGLALVGGQAEAVKKLQEIVGLRISHPEAY